MRRRQIRARCSRNGSNDGAALKCELLAGIQVGDDNRRLELGDAGNRDGRLLLRIVIVLVGPVVDFGKKLRRNTSAALERPDLRMVDRNLKGVFASKGGSRGQGVVGGVGASFAGKVDGHVSAGSGQLPVAATGGVPTPGDSQGVSVPSVQAAFGTSEQSDQMNATISGLLSVPGWVPMYTNDKPVYYAPLNWHPDALNNSGTYNNDKSQTFDINQLTSSATVQPKSTWPTLCIPLSMPARAESWARADAMTMAAV